MKKVYSVIALILLSLIVSGCATTQRVATPSGKPEIVINTTDRGRIKSVITNEFMNAGFTMVSESDYSVVFSKPMEGVGGVMYQATLGNPYSSSPEWNARINMATTGTSTRVMAQAVVKMQNAFGREDVNDMTNGKAGVQLQEILQRVEAQIEGSKMPTGASGPNPFFDTTTIYDDGQQAGQRIAWVRFDIALDSTAETRDQNKLLKDDEAAANVTLEIKNSEGQALVALLKANEKTYEKTREQNNLSASERATLVSEAESLVAKIQAKQADVKNFRESTQRSLQDRIQAYRAQSLEKMIQVATRVAKAGGYNRLVSGKQAPAGVEADDITPTVITALNAEYQPYFLRSARAISATQTNKLNEHRTGNLDFYPNILCAVFFHIL